MRSARRGSRMSFRHQTQAQLMANIQPPVQPELPTWSEIKNPSSVIARRCNHASVILYVYGGYESSANGVYADFKRYCFKDKEWSSLANGDEDGPGPRHCHSMVVHQNQIYLFGGITSVFDSVSDVHKYDLQTQTWSKITCCQSPPKTDSHKAVIYESTMLIYSGFFNNQFSSNIYSLNLQTSHWQILFNSQLTSQPYPTPRANCSLSLHNTNLYIHAGRNLQTIFSDLWVYNLTSNKFLQIVLNNGNFSPRAGHSTIIHNDKLIIFGGISGITHERNDLIIYNIIQNNVKSLWQNSQKVYNQVQKHNERRITKQCEIIKIDSICTQLLLTNVIGAYRRPFKDVQYSRTNEQISRVRSKHKNDMKHKKCKNRASFDNSKSRINLSSAFEALNDSIIYSSDVSTLMPSSKQPNNTSVQKNPKARDNHTADIFSNQTGTYMVIFGGDMHRTCFNDLILVDLQLLTKK